MDYPERVAGTGLRLLSPGWFRMSTKNERPRWRFWIGGLIMAAVMGSSPGLAPPQDSARDANEAMATAEAVGLGPAALEVSPVRLPAASPKPTFFLNPAQADLVAPFVELGAMDSWPGETQHNFLVRVAQAMDLFSRQTSFEACGVILKAAGASMWRVRLTTHRSHIACLMVSFEEPGFAPTGEDIHSHPRVIGGALANAQDVERNPRFACNQRMVVFDERFSERDLDRGPGYLVSRGRLMYQRGRSYPFQLRAAFDPIQDKPSLAFASAPMLASAQADGHLPALAEAVWANADAEGLLPTACEEEETLPNDEQIASP